MKSTTSLQNKISCSRKFGSIASSFSVIFILALACRNISCSVISGLIGPPSAEDDVPAGVQPPTPLLVTTTKTKEGVLHQLWDDLGTSKTAFSSVMNAYTPRIITNYLTRQITEQVIDIEVAVHVSAQKEKLDNLLVGLQHWGGPASVAVYVSSEEDIDELEDFLQKHKDGPLMRANVHVVLEKPLDPSTTKPYYPHNILRNLAMQNVVGDYFLALDGDLIPGSNTYQDLMYLLNLDSTEDHTNIRDMLQRQQVLVLPAFEVFSKNDMYRSFKSMVPKSRDDLLTMFKGEHPFAKAQMFHETDYKPSHQPTNFTRWMNVDVSSAGKNDTAKYYYYEIQYEGGFEPYVLAYKPGIPRYYEPFRGFYFNKISWFKELNRAGYKFHVLTDCFVVHLNHKLIDDKRKFKMFVTNKRRLKRFDSYLDRRYPKKE